MRAALAVPARLHRGWRRSLQTRVVVTTLVLSATVSLLLGITILHQVQQGLLDAASRSATAQLSTGLQRAQSQFTALPHTDRSAVERTADSVVADLSGRAGQDDYDVVMLSATDGLRSYSHDVSAAAVPVALRRVVTAQSRQAWTYTRLSDDGGASHAGLVAGGPVQAGGYRYQLYYLFPLVRESQVLGLVERTMLFAGGALVLLLVGIAAVVTRQVVRPVRQAAATAGQLAAGRLEGRMRVRGEDDLATLAASFNRMADTVQQQISQLQELSRVQRRFVADVSHELRTPITTIRMAADVLHSSSADLPPALGRSSELLQTQLDRFESLLGDLLEISRYDAGVAALDAEPMDVSLLAARVLDAAAGLAERHGSRLRLERGPGALVIDADPRRIERVMRNLVDNAVEHADGTDVVVTVRGGDSAVAITVRDGGIGLRPGESSLVFGRFWRADPARTRTTGGSGLGLSIALEDVRLHGGWLQAWGEPGRGAVFRLTLPWHAGGVVAESPLPLEPDDGGGPGPRPASPVPLGPDVAARV